jgi:hypothetical protein
LAEAIHIQIGEGTGPVPVAEIAKALDIVQIRIEPLTNFEGALVTTPERDVGLILVNRSSSSRRRRFTIGHELLHFLNAWHQPTSVDGFRCSRADMRENQRKSQDWHLRQEAEANAFSIELLAPRTRLRPFLQNEPDLAAAISMSDDLDISREAAARRYVSCHGETIAAVFGHGGRFLYYEGAARFPSLSLRKGSLLPNLPPGNDTTGLSIVDEAEVSEWLSRPDGASLTMQTLHQQDGYSTTLLRVIPVQGDDDEDDDVDDVFDRFSRFGS